MIYLNLGCGLRHHPDWINIDIAPCGPGVLVHDLSTGIPRPDASCDVVYHSHVLEHLRHDQALPFTRECHRVLKPGGIIRVAIPDLERIAGTYLEKLRAAAAGDPVAEADYDWMMLELLDQTVRETEGGAMLQFLLREPIPNEPFIYQRIGGEGRAIVEMIRRERMRGPVPQPVGPAPAVRRSLFQRAVAGVKQALDRFDDGTPKPAPAKDEADRRALQIGRFRLEGEVHQWMYDRFSLARLLLAVGFAQPREQAADQSAIPGWAGFCLDTEPDGTSFKPDSLYMEAVKPGVA